MSAQGSTSGVSRDAFVARVTRALGRGGVVAPEESAPSVDEAVVRVAKKDQDLVALFAERAGKTGMVLHRTSRADEFVLELLAKLGARRVAVSGSLDGISAGLTARGIEAVEWKNVAGVGPLFEVDVGVTDVQGAVAETGSIVCAAGVGRGRGLSLVPPVHVAMVRASQIVADLVDLFGSFGEVESGVVLITGPSKTADIEGVLITGVHGPREVHLVVEG